MNKINQIHLRLFRFFLFHLWCFCSKKWNDSWIRNYFKIKKEINDGRLKCRIFITMLYCFNIFTCTFFLAFYNEQTFKILLVDYLDSSNCYCMQLCYTYLLYAIYCKIKLAFILVTKNKNKKTLKKSILSKKIEIIFSTNERIQRHIEKCFLSFFLFKT